MAKLVGKDVHSWAVTVQSQLATTSWVALLAHLLEPCTSPCQVVCQLILIQTSVLPRFRGKKGNYTIWICLKKVTEQNVTSILIAQQPNHSCHVSTQQEL